MKIRSMAIAAIVATAGMACGDDATSPSTGALLVAESSTQLSLGAGESATLEVRLLSEDGAPVQGRQISWLTEEGGGSAQPSASTTDAQGVAATSWTVPAEVGTYRLHARHQALQDVVFTAVVLGTDPPAASRAPTAPEGAR